MKFKIDNREILVDGESDLILAGEIHYYRLNKEDWQDRIDKLKEAGYNTVASYIPWCVHEQAEGDLDLTGKYREQYDLVSFLKLIIENDLYFIARPGPFVMAEMVNDGIPTWVSEKYPHLKCTSWDSKVRTTVTLDYTHPDFLKESEKWLKSICEVLNPYYEKNLVSIQLDNEIGMLSWVSNNPDLSLHVVSEFQQYLKNNNLTLNIDEQNLSIKELQKYLETPKEEYSIKFHDYYMRYSRYRFKKYTDYIKQIYLDYGFEDTLFSINIHGTGAGKLFGYPIGISQLYETYRNDDKMFSGSDIYFGTMNISNISDIYMSNELTKALNSSNQPLTSLEYNSVDGNFGNNYGARYLSSTSSLKTRLMISQDCKLINFYLFSGGFNSKMNKSLNNKSDLMASTGYYHGYGAPVGPEGQLSYLYNDTKKTVKQLTNLSKYFSNTFKENDNISVAFNLDYYLVEYHYPQSESNEEKYENIKKNSGNEMYDVICRYMIAKNYNFDVTELTTGEIKTELLILPSARYMSEEVQTKLVNYIQQGGKVIVYGELPTMDMYGNSCTLLIDELGIEIESYTHIMYFNKEKLLLEPTNLDKFVPASFHNKAQNIKVNVEHDIYLKQYDRDTISSAMINNQVFLLLNEYRCDIDFFDQIFEKLGVKRKLSIDTEMIGVYGSVLKSDKGIMFSVINMDDIKRDINITYNDKKIFEQDFEIDALEGLYLPYNFQTDNCKIIKSTCELYDEKDNIQTYRIATDKVYIILETQRNVDCKSENVIITKKDNVVEVRVQNRLYNQEYISLEFN